jgi:hypothetical protein
LSREKAVVKSKEELEPTLQSIKKAVDNGEFDKLIGKAINIWQSSN